MYQRSKSNSTKVGIRMHHLLIILPLSNYRSSNVILQPVRPHTMCKGFPEILGQRVVRNVPIIDKTVHTQTMPLLRKTRLLLSARKLILRNKDLSLLSVPTLLPATYPSKSMHVLVSHFPYRYRTIWAPNFSLPLHIHSSVPLYLSES